MFDCLFVRVYLFCQHSKVNYSDCLFGDTVCLFVSSFLLIYINLLSSIHMYSLSILPRETIWTNRQIMFKYIVVLSIAFVGIAIALLGIGRKQSAGATGTLMCDSSPAANVLVKLYDNNGRFIFIIICIVIVSAIGLDGFMGQTRTDSQGHFQVSGYQTDITTLDPKLNIYHDCHNSLVCFPL